MSDRALNEVDKAMLHILSLDSSAAVKFSTFTGSWYVEARLEVSNGTFLKGGTEHRPTPDRAVVAYFTYLTGIQSLDECIVANAHRDNRRHYRWNGATFAEVPMPERIVTGWTEANT